MAYDDHKNFAEARVATAPSPPTSGTSLGLGAGERAKFPAAPFNATVWPAGTQPTSSNAEIVRVTNNASDTLTIQRAQEASAVRSILTGDQIAATITKKTLTDLEANGYWTTVPFNAADFTGAGGMTWTVEAGDVVSFAYTLVGKTMTVAIYLGNTVIGGTLYSMLQVLIPGGRVAANYSATVGWVFNNGIFAQAMPQTTLGGTTISITRIDGNFPVAGLVNVYFTFTFQIV